MSEGGHLCWWCKKPIDPRRHPFVISTQKLPNGGTFSYRFHAQKKDGTPCYRAYKEFLALHEFQPLDPTTHEHDE